jgi:SAM-dependent methyltransferase
MRRLWTKLFGRLRAAVTQTVSTELAFHATPEEYKQAAIDFPHRTPDRHYLYTKPFDAGKDKGYTIRLLRRFASMLEILNLTPRAKVLDVACGPGWVSEFLARSGYDVVGIDISPDMIRVARERIEAVRFGSRQGQPLEAQFSVSDAETEDLGNEFYHAAIFYDSLHHFPNPQAALERVFRALKPGGKLYITEGIKPPPGSESEKKLIEAMIRFGALEKPFDQPELFDLLRKVGFVDIQAFEPLNFILKRNGSKTVPALRNVPVPMTNTILARKPGGEYDSRFPNVLKAEISAADASPPQLVEAGSTLEVTISLENVGDTLWLSEPSAKGGFVTLATKLFDENKCLLSDMLERTRLPHDVLPAQTIVLTHRFTAPAQPGSYWIKLDLVSESVAWFENEGSQPFEFAIRVETRIDN